MRETLGAIFILILLFGPIYLILDVLFIVISSIRSGQISEEEEERRRKKK